MKIISSVFQNNSKIPAKYTCDGQNINPPLSFLEMPSNAKSLALIVDDPDAPGGVWTHWLVFNIDPKVIGVAENSIPTGGSEGMTSFGNKNYGGPCPPAGTHRYFFILYALNSILNLTNPDKTELENAMRGHILDRAELIGNYNRD
ncbi:MAG: phospholipid-binding protein, family [Candidatus Levybacteria bacterium]|nr:phospholipid-binding protein, family [Candidatus Levybacteria bacterium]